MISDLPESPVAPAASLIYGVISSTVHPPAMSKVESSSTSQPTKEDAIPGLGVLEEDDEFEEFPVQGKYAL